MKFFSFVLFTLLIMASCSKVPTLAPIYEGILHSDGGNNRFPIYVEQDLNNPSIFSAYVVNGLDTARFTRSNFLSPTTVLFSFEHYDSHILADIQADGSLKGTWKKRLSGGEYEPMEFSANPVSRFVRYPNPKHNPESSVFDGEWQVTFMEEDGSTYPATGVFHSAKNGFFGTFLTETGDYRFLEGSANDTSFIISDFDGGHAFRFNATLQKDGSLKGDFWSRKSYHETFTAIRGENKLADAYSLTELSEPNAKIDFSFPDLNGNIITNHAEQFKNKPMLVYLFGSWCPTCADEAKMLREVYAKSYKDTDLQIVGIAFEYTGDFAQDAEMVKLYRKRFQIPWTTLVGGSNDKLEASKLLPFVKEIKSFPSSFFVNREGIITAVHTGFKGPGTGAYHLEEKQHFIKNIDSILN